MTFADIFDVNKWQENMSELVDGWITALNIAPAYTEEFKVTLAVVSLIVLCVVADLLFKRLILTSINRIARNTETDWDDVLVEKKVFHNLAHLVPPLILELLLPVFFQGHSWIIFGGLKVAETYLSIVVIALVIALIRALEVFGERHPYMKDKPVGSYTQLVRILVYVVGGIYVISVLLDKSPLGIFSALGAMSVVLMLVFKDTILGFAASIQLAANDMVKIGDWVEFPKYGADGEIMEIKLQTIKVRNWDKTITNVPTYAFVSDAFKNWRGMEESGGRRIKRSVFIDMSTIRLCDEEMLERYRKIKYITKYLSDKQEEIAAHNSKEGLDLSSLVNGRRITNMGTFRAYVAAYLENHPMINKEMTFLVRQLQPTEHGLPLEVYVFSSEKSWAKYENIQADIFDHILSIVKEFDLKIFQNPTGSDFQNLLK